MTRTARLARRKGWHGGPLARTYEARPRGEQAVVSVAARRPDSAWLAALELALPDPKAKNVDRTRIPSGTANNTKATATATRAPQTRR